MVTIKELDQMLDNPILELIVISALILLNVSILYGIYIREKEARKERVRRFHRNNKELIEYVKQRE